MIGRAPAKTVNVLVMTAKVLLMIATIPAASVFNQKNIDNY